MLNAEIGERLRGAVEEPHFHNEGVCGRMREGAEADAVGEGSLHFVIAVLQAGPFKMREEDVLAGPNGGDMRVGEVGEAKVGPDRFGNISDDVAVFIPGSKDAELGFALRIDRAFEKADARVATAGVREHKESGGRVLLWFSPGINIEFSLGLLDFIRGKASGFLDFVRSEMMKPDHVLEPRFKFLIVFWRTRFRVEGVERKMKREEKNEQAREHGLFILDSREIGEE